MFFAFDALTRSTKRSIFIIFNFQMQPINIIRTNATKQHVRMSACGGRSLSPSRLSLWRPTPVQTSSPLNIKIEPCEVAAEPINQDWFAEQFFAKFALLEDALTKLLLLVALLADEGLIADSERQLFKRLLMENKDVKNNEILGIFQRSKSLYHLRSEFRGRLGIPRTRVSDDNRSRSSKCFFGRQHAKTQISDRSAPYLKLMSTDKFKTNEENGTTSTGETSSLLLMDLSFRYRTEH